MIEQSTCGVEWEDPDDSVCTTFSPKPEHADEDGKFAFIWSFECTRCGKDTLCAGDPTEFGGRPFSCQHCRWVSLLDQESVESFADEHYDHPDTDEEEGSR